MKKWRDTYRNQFDQNRCREEARSAADWEKESMDMGEKKRSENALAETACIRKARSGLAGRDSGDSSGCGTAIFGMGG